MPSLLALEDYLKDHIFPDLDKGRPDWDKPHTENVVGRLKLIIANSPDLEVDSEVLLIAAYAHDWGYSGIFHFGQNYTLNQVMTAKSAHMVLGADKVTRLLQTDFFTFLTPVQKNRISHLVRVHDLIDQLVDTDELLLMEADTLGALDSDVFKPFPDKSSGREFLNQSLNTRLPRFITSYGRRQFHRLYTARKMYYANH